MRPPGTGGRDGLTLLEMAIVLILAGLLAVVSVSTYTWMVNRARMTQARLALAHLRKAEAVYYSEYARYTDNLALLDLDPVKYDYYTVSVRLTDPVTYESYKGYAHGRGAMTGDLWTVTDNTDPVQDNSSRFRR